VQRLRFSVFNLELGKGLAESFQTGLDADPYDEVCDHLLVETEPDGEVVGTYRLQTGRNAMARLGFYSAREFDFAPFAPRAAEMVELGRACMHRDHRSPVVLGLLWKGITRYAGERGCRYLIGCSSIPSTEPEVGARLYSNLMRRFLAPGESITRPHSAWACPLDRLSPTPVRLPKLLGVYLSLGARICGSPAIDLEFQTLDLLTWADLASLTPRANSLRALWLQAESRRVLATLHVTLDVEGRPPERGLVAANHLSYLDILVLGAAAPMLFVSKAEVRDWPLFGWLSRSAGTIYIRRDRRSDVHRAAQELQFALVQGTVVALFPEGTSTDGTRVLPFRSALLDAAIKANAPITPAAIDYLLADGNAATEVCYWGDMTLVRHILNLATKRAVRARVTFGSPVAPNTDRKVAARRSRDAVVALRGRSRLGRDDDVCLRLKTQDS
jgi:1-acyl-sn-glycerol-3-phosphate acyltransferase